MTFDIFFVKELCYRSLEVEGSPELVQTQDWGPEDLWKPRI